MTTLDNIRYVQGVISSVGQGALAALPITLAVVAGLFDVASKRVMISSRTHLAAQVLLVGLGACVVGWCLSLAFVAIFSESEQALCVLRIVLWMQFVFLGISSIVLIVVSLNYSRLVQRGISG